jgi:alpha-L-arabinofuranosidase
LIAAALVAALTLPGSGRIEIDATRLGARIPARLYGVFLEEINNAGEGGLYAELIQNRGFEDASAPPGCTIRDGELRAPKNPSFWEGRSKDFRMPWPYRDETPAWSLQGEGTTMRLTSARPLTPASPHALELTVKTPGAQVVNEGFWGMNAVAGEKYDLSFFALNDGYRGGLEARLLGANGEVLAAHRLPNVPGGGWKKHRATLTPTRSDPKARFALVPLGTGKLLLDFVSLFPAKTFRNRPNGLRPDLAQRIADLKPGFIRWPGGCVVEGITIETRPRWEQTLGPLEGRVPTFIPWGYWVSNGFGYHEWLQFCEDVGAEPLYVFNVGVSCAFRSGTFLPDSDLPALIQNTLDAIEYAVGPTTSKWGAMRAKAGHPKPFPMRMVEIGNEQQGPRYGARVKLFTEAIKRKYPRMKVALSSWIAGIDQPAIDAAGPQLDVVDEHAYKPVNWAVQNFDAFAKYPRDVPWELYIGEFATNAGVGRGNMRATLGDAATMMSMEKNADLVKMGSYAPLLENTNRRQWEVNLIHFDSARTYGRASYYACKLFAENRPDVNLATTVAYTPAGESPIRGPIGLGTYGTQAEFKDVRVEQGGRVTELSDFSRWQPRSGRWSVRDGAYRQTDLEHDRWTYFGDGFQDATVTLKARKVAGDEGFVVSVGNADGRRVHFNVGGWGNRLHGLEAGGPVKQVPGRVETGRWYDVKVRTEGRRVRAYLDDRLIFDETLPRVDTVLAIAGREERSGDLIVKVLNPGSAPADLRLDLKGVALKGSGTLTELASEDAEAENSYAEPRKIVPVVRAVSVRDGAVQRRFPAHSLSILRLRTR